MLLWLTSGHTILCLRLPQNKGASAPTRCSSSGGHQGPLHKIEFKTSTFIYIRAKKKFYPLGILEVCDTVAIIETLDHKFGHFEAPIQYRVPVNATIHSAFVCLAPACCPHGAAKDRFTRDRAASSAPA